MGVLAKCLHFGGVGYDFDLVRVHVFIHHNLVRTVHVQGLVAQFRLVVHYKVLGGVVVSLVRFRNVA